MNWPADHLPSRPIVVDTREQDPYEFPIAVRGTLKQGDYSLEGLQHVVVVERKSLPDLVSSLMQGRKRFRREMERLQESVRWPWLVVESSLSAIAAGNYRSEANPRSVLASAFAWAMRYGVFFLPACDRLHGAAAVAMILRLAEREHDRGGGRRAQDRQPVEGEG